MLLLCFSTNDIIICVGSICFAYVCETAADSISYTFLYYLFLLKRYLKSLFSSFRWWLTKHLQMCFRWFLKLNPFLLFALGIHFLKVPQCNCVVLNQTDKQTNKQMYIWRHYDLCLLSVRKSFFVFFQQLFIESFMHYA